MKTALEGNTTFAITMWHYDTRNITLTLKELLVRKYVMFVVLLTSATLQT
jgi:hypothetical protein